ncbi:hypothetical protein P171DRAFT_392136 [Karstenula rhodostoma CBS 690.94]|uniref:F-box domain-containing protein n=1 Tax=Karstenula rhodostoma CBS 690.94 TaxID=1392251 RepID=A0A9P4PEE6_9PLEO|nr:hypothetical protein P171DRAFT_392136 [Karstenula rhodostoma CBS 690.94]
MTELLDLCYDVLIRILEEIDPEDVGRCAQTSHGFNDFIKQNTRLYKAQYLRNFDDPRRRPTDPEPAWIPELQRLVRCRKMLESANGDLKRDEFRFIASTLDTLIATGSTDSLGESHNQQLITKLFQPIYQNHGAFLCRSSLYDRCSKPSQKPADDEEDRQLSAKLLCLFGIPSGNVGNRVLSAHTYARSRVYDLRNYTDATAWGPFRDDGSMRVDWEMVESLMVVLCYNSGLCGRQFIHRFRPPWTQPLEGVLPARDRILPAYPPKLYAQPEIPLSLRDPYNVSGVWSRIVCFLDYNDLYQYNFNAEAMKVPADQPRDPIHTEEAIRHIVMDLKVTEVLAPSEFDNQALPVVKFTGTSRSVDLYGDPNANSKLRGSVRLTPDGEVRWRTISVFYGEERWRSEGIQVGGVRSQRGVIGTWFDKDMDPHGPAGPTAFWKICDTNELDSEGSEEVEVEEEDEEDGVWFLQEL